ncbi:MAG: PIG-L family deacetylase [Candidatus Dormibacteria bacterium]
MISMVARLQSLPATAEGLAVTGALDTGRSRRLLVVHAHPDDESITTGLLARCGDAAIETTLMTCTDGRYGPVNPELGVQLTPDQLADARAAELDEAARILAISEVRRLGYHDSNMTGLAQNQAPLAFWAQSTEVLVARLVGLIREVQPHVVVTYDAFGNTGHPDHIQAHRITMLAVVEVVEVAEARCFPAAGSSLERAAGLPSRLPDLVPAAVRRRGAAGRARTPVRWPGPPRDQLRPAGRGRHPPR